MFHHILYLSSAAVPFDDTALVRLLDVSRRNNAVVDVSGMLLYDDGNFIQYLEGEEDALRAVFDRIGRDSRHTGILVVSEGPADRRIFVDWSMGFGTLSPHERLVLGRFGLNRAALESRIGAEAPAMLKTMMQNFYECTHRFASA